MSFLVLAAGGAVFASGFWPADPGWMGAVLGVVAVLAAVAVLLWRGVEWASSVGIGLAAFSAGVWLQSVVALGVMGAQDSAAQTSITTCLVCLVASLVAVGLAWAAPRTVARRHTLATVFAGAALAPSVLFALSPTQSPTTAALMGLGALGVLAGTVAVGRGRTWGLFVGFVGAVVIATGVASAPTLGHLATPHPWLPNGAGFLVIVQGICAAVFAAMPSVIFVGPVLRFLRRG